MLTINPKQETKKIIKFIQTTLQKNNIKNVVIGVSGGIDSVTSLYLLAKSIPAQNIYPMHLYYFDSSVKQSEKLIEETKIPKQNIQFLSIKKPVNEIKQLILNSRWHEGMGSRQRADLWVWKESRALTGREFVTESAVNKIRIGNIMARVRMIILYDFAKKLHGLVCGTENKTEHLLGYFTRFGDAASDIEPIQHLYKTQVYKLAQYLNIPNSILNQTPTAGLWHGQTDEGELGFTYKEADEVLYLFYDKKYKVSEIEAKGYENSRKIIEFFQKNNFKTKTPYRIDISL